jgi:hypothetical protein
MILPVIVIYLVIAAVDITLGIGSIRCRRWARSLLQLWSIYWLVVGVCSIAVFLFVFSGMDEAMARSGTKLPAGFGLMMKAFMMLFMGLIYVVIPGIFTWFYSLRDTRLTCETRNPQTCWTDLCPSPVLGLSLISAMCALCLPAILAFAPVFPFFGFYWKGWPAVLLILAACGAFGWSAWGLYRLRKSAWWANLAVTLFFMASYIVTFTRGGLMEMYRQMELPAQTMKVLEENPFLQNQWIGLAGLLYVIPYAGLMLFVRKYFQTKE